MFDPSQLGPFLARTDPRLRLGTGLARIDDAHALAPVEASAMARARPGRRAEFAAGRAAARMALRDIGLVPYAIAMGHDRAPVWPKGIVGSISHSGGLALAIVARQSDLKAIGCDLEPAEPLDPALWPEILSPGEQASCLEPASLPSGLLARAIFSAKEACYKALYPRSREVAGFDLLTISLSDAVRAGQGQGAFQARLNRAYGAFRAGEVFEGQLLITDKAILGLVILPAAFPKIAEQRGGAGAEMRGVDAEKTVAFGKGATGAIGTNAP